MSFLLKPIMLNKTNNNISNLNDNSSSINNNSDNFSLAIFNKQSNQLYFGDDVQVDPYTGSLRLVNGTVKGLNRQSWYIKEQKPSNVHGGNFDSNCWIPRKFNVFDGIVGMGVCLVGDGSLQIEPGEYNIEGHAPALGVGQHQVRFQNLTDNITESFGTSECSYSDEQCSSSKIAFHLFVNQQNSKIFQLQHKCSGGRPGDGFGRATGFSDTNEIYSVIRVQKLA